MSQRRGDAHGVGRRGGKFSDVGLERTLDDGHEVLHRQAHVHELEHKVIDTLVHAHDMHELVFCLCLFISLVKQQ